VISQIVHHIPSKDISVLATISSLIADSDWLAVELTLTVWLRASQPPQTQIQHPLEEIVRFST